jgi:hypothetical protein
MTRHLLECADTSACATSCFFVDACNANTKANLGRWLISPSWGWLACNINFIESGIGFEPGCTERFQSSQSAEGAEKIANTSISSQPRWGAQRSKSTARVSMLNRNILKSCSKRAHTSTELLGRCEVRMYNLRMSSSRTRLG